MINLKAPLPTDMGKLSVVYRKARELRLAMQKEVDLVAAYEKAAKDALINGIPKSGEGIVADGYAIRVTTTTKPVIEDWQAVMAHVAATGDIDLIQKRLSDRAVADRWANGASVPGVGTFNHIDLSVTKVR